MTNILDTVRADFSVCVDNFLGLYTSAYSRETVERLLAEHRKQVLLEAAERCTEMAIAGNPTEDETWSNATALDCAEELSRMAAEGEN